MKSIAELTGVIYCRVSSWEQVANTSLERQERECRDYAKRQGIRIVTSAFVEEGESAKSANRTQFQKALAFCSKERPSHFIVYKLDRFARNQQDHVTTHALLKKFGTTLVSVTEPIDQTSMGRALEGMLAVFAELDNNVRADRSKDGMIEKVRRGIWVWQAPIGYKRLTKGGNLVVDEPKADYIRLAFEEYAKGSHSFQSLADLLHSRGFRSRSGKKIYAQLIEKILRNHIYYGSIRAFDEEHMGSFAPLISQELFWRCQPGGRVKSRFKGRSTDNTNFPLRRFVICDSCGGSLTGSASRGKSGKKYHYYHHQKQNCEKAKSLSKAQFENSFANYLTQVSPKPEYQKLFKAVVLDTWESNYKKLDSDNARIRREIEVLEEERQKIFTLHRSGTYNDQEFRDQKDWVNLQIQQKEMFLEDNRIEAFDMEEALDYCFGLVSDSAKTWVSLEGQPAYRLRFQKQIFPEKVTYDGEKFGTPKTSLIYGLCESADADSTNLVTQTGNNWNRFLLQIKAFQVLK